MFRQYFATDPTPGDPTFKHAGTSHKLGGHATVAERSTHRYTEHFR
jgi:hypothetical protein